MMMVVGDIKAGRFDIENVYGEKIQDLFKFQALNSKTNFDLIENKPDSVPFTISFLKF